MNIFDDIPNNLNSELFETLIESDNVKIERIISKGHCSPETGWYNQENNEWVIIIKGEAQVVFANELPQTLKEGDYLHINAHQKHKVIWTHPDQETIWLAVHY